MRLKHDKLIGFLLSPMRSRSNKQYHMMKKGEKYQYKESHMEEGKKKSFRRDKLLQKGMVLLVCFQMEMIHFTVKN